MRVRFPPVLRQRCSSIGRVPGLITWEVVGSSPTIFVLPLFTMLIMNKSKPIISPEDWETCITVLTKLKDHPELAHDELVLKGLVSKMYKNARKRNRLAAANQHAEDHLKEIDSTAFEGMKQKGEQSAQSILKERDRVAKEATYIFQRNDDRVEDLPKIQENNRVEDQTLYKASRCYVCKQKFKELHFFYHLLCSKCGEFNYQKRKQTTELNDRVALITGGRIKIGFELGVKMLRDGASLIVTTRFPQDAQKRYEQVEDYTDWKNRLHIYGLDLRNIPQVEQFIQHLYQEFDYLDILINNAAQTIKRPLAFYQHLLEGEQQNYLIEASKKDGGHQLAVYEQYFPAEQYDKDQQQVDLRPENSWVVKLEEVDTMEMLEVQLVNVTAPFLLNARLRKLMEQSPFERKFIINVSAMEGQFYKTYKSANHPHTNMAKASLNMMTRTSAADYAKAGIFMNSVDTGWITNENPHPKKEKMRDQHFVPPIDIVDGAARVYDPIVMGINDTNKTPVFGLFLKDYRNVSW